MIDVLLTAWGGVAICGMISMAPLAGRWFIPPGERVMRCFVLPLLWPLVALLLLAAWLWTRFATVPR